MKRNKLENPTLNQLLCIMADYERMGIMDFVKNTFILKPQVERPPEDFMKEYGNRYVIHASIDTYRDKFYLKIKI